MAPPYKYLTVSDVIEYLRRVPDFYTLAKVLKGCAVASCDVVGPRRYVISLVPHPKADYKDLLKRLEEVSSMFSDFFDMEVTVSITPYKVPERRLGGLTTIGIKAMAQMLEAIMPNVEERLNRKELRERLMAEWKKMKAIEIEDN